MKKEQNKVKAVGYAYPSSTNAKAAGFYGIGCYTVESGKHAKPLKLVKGFATLKEAQNYAAGLPMPFEFIFGKAMDGSSFLRD